MATASISGLINPVRLPDSINLRHPPAYPTFKPFQFANPQIKYQHASANTGFLEPAHKDKDRRSLTQQLCGLGNATNAVNKPIQDFISTESTQQTGDTQPIVTGRKKTSRPAAAANNRPPKNQAPLSSTSVNTRGKTRGK